MSVLEMSRDSSLPRLILAREGRSNVPVASLQIRTSTPAADRATEDQVPAVPSTMMNLRAGRNPNHEGPAQSRALTLTMLRGPETVPPETRTVVGGELAIGRGSENDWILLDRERYLSKRHCVLAYRSGNWQIADLSTNGTFLNREAEPIGRGQPRQVRDGDRLRLGAYEFELRIAATPADLVTAAAPIFRLLAWAGNPLNPPDDGDLHERAVRAMHEFEQRARDLGLPTEQMQPAHYALCASFDDLVLNTPWGSIGVWDARPLVSIFHQELSSGDRFFDLLVQMRQNPGRFLPVIELMYSCMSLGFQGRYRISPRGSAELDRLREETYSLITQERYIALPPDYDPLAPDPAAPIHPDRSPLLWDWDPFLPPAPAPVAPGELLDLPIGSQPWRDAPPPGAMRTIDANLRAERFAPGETATLTVVIRLPSNPARGKWQSTATVDRNLGPARGILEAQGFTVVSEPPPPFEVPDDRDTAPVAFELRIEEANHRWLHIVLTQGGRPAGELTINDFSGVGHRPAQQGVSSTFRSVAEADLMLVVRHADGRIEVCSPRDRASLDHVTMTGFRYPAIPFRELLADRLRHSMTIAPIPKKQRVSFRSSASSSPPAYQPIS